MEKNKTIKELYKCNYIKSNEELYPLQKWYNQLIDKKFSEINVFDVLRMIRQNEFVDLAIAKAVSLLKSNPFIGDMYDGELLEKLSKVNLKYLKAFNNELKEILLCASKENKNYKWINQEEQEEFEIIIKKFKEKISEI